MNSNLPNQCEPRLGSAVLSSAVTLWAAVLIGLAMFCLGGGRGYSAESTPKEFRLKAEFIYKFTKFVDWPVRLADTNAPFVVAVAGESPCTVELEEIAKERKVNSRQLIIKMVTNPEALTGAHVLFIPASGDARTKEWLTAAHAAGTLSIGESEPIARHGGIIHLVLEGEKIRFDLNIFQAEAAGLKISAQLQKLARTVRRKP